MSAMLIKNIPPSLHERLRQRAAAHHRSMNGEVIAILEQELNRSPVTELPPPVKTLKPIDHGWTVRVIRDARDGKR